MQFWTVFLNHGERIWTVTRQKGELDVETGLRPRGYQFKRELAIIGSKNLGFSSHLHLDESSIALAKEVELVVIDGKAYVTELKASMESLYIYKIDKVKGSEYDLILAQVPA